MRSGRQADEDDRRVRRSEARHRPTPVLFRTEGRALGSGDLLPPSHQPGARRAPAHRLIELGDVRSIIGCRRRRRDRFVYQFRQPMIATKESTASPRTRRVPAMATKEDPTQTSDASGQTTAPAQPTDDHVTTLPTIN